MSEEMAQAEPVEVVETEAPQEAPQEEEVSKPEETIEQRLDRLERERDTLKKKNSRQKAALKALNERQQQQQPQAEAKPLGDEPKPEDFETQEDFVNAVVEYRTEKATQAKLEEQRQQAHLLEQQELMNKRAAIKKESEDKFREINPNYDEADQEVRSFYETNAQSINPHTYFAIVDAVYDYGDVAELTNYFGENNGERIDELDAISRMSPVKAGIEIYKISQSLKSTNKQTTKNPLPKPPKKVEGKSQASKPLAKRSGKDVLEWVNS